MTAPYYEVKLFPGELRLLVNNDGIAEIAYNFICKFKTDVFVRELSSAVEDGDLDFVTSLQEAGDFTHFDPQVVLADFEAETHLLELCGFGGAFVFLQLLGALVVVFTPISDFYDWWVSGGGNFYEVELLISGELQGFGTFQNT